MVDYRMFSGKLDTTELDSERHDAITSWLTIASAETTPFKQFIFRWMSFNGWMACVTGEDRDTEMLKVFCKDKTAIATFVRLMKSSSEFAEAVKAFAALWPIFNAADVYKLGDKRPHATNMEERPAYVEALWPMKSIRRRPPRWNPKKPAKPQLKDLFGAIYQVRCNLFHGDKVSYAEIDAQLVDHANTCLRLWLEQSHCYVWPTQQAA